MLQFISQRKLMLCMVLLAGFFLLHACSSDSQPEPTLPDCIDDNVTYDNQIKPIITTYCDHPNCHNSGSSFGDYTSFQLMASVINSGLFEERVIDLPVGNNSKMPPPYATIGPDVMTSEDLQLVECWIAGGYPEN